jgi:transcriptional regulator with XRE-family HTH domain
MHADYALRMSGVIAENVKALRRQLGLNQQAFAEKLGVQQSYVSKWEADRVEPNGDSIAAMAKLAGCSFEAFKSGRLGTQVISSDQPVARSVDAGDTVQIARLDLSLPMGPGATVDDYVEEEALTFDAGYVRSFTRTPPHRLRLASGAGDSMFPTLVPNDLVWIDTTQNQLLHSDRIYAASINGGATIKRLRPTAGGKRIVVISDNKTIEPYEVDAADVLIWGRVIRFARDL